MSDAAGNKVIELDGDRWGPLVHDDLDGRDEGFGAKARRVIKTEYFERDEMGGMFSVLALVRQGHA